MLTIGDFCSAGDIDAISRLVVAPARVRPLMEDYYSRYPLTSRKVLEFGVMGLNQAWGRDIIIANYRTDRVGSEVIMLDLTSGKPKVDWESFVAYGEMDWDSFVRAKGEEPTMFRCYATPDTYYAYEFAQKTRYRCVRLRHPKSGHILYGYVRADTPMGPQPLTEGDATTETPVILRIQFPPDALRDNQVIITEILQRYWIWENPEDGDGKPEG